MITDFIELVKRMEKRSRSQKELRKTNIIENESSRATTTNLNSSLEQIPPMKIRRVSKTLRDFPRKATSIATEQSRVQKQAEFTIATFSLAV
ncbi:hypothetical protein K0M31_001102 [Melipona bicolor]|uniref:Uncharacterized protein n=1 Tax=Melipona bicolor TaxID=60889 RepID=A0AA40GEV6_9HYME|nr:hypothetical protein K0M31_001102 [Melipona bicolor]